MPIRGIALVFAALLAPLAFAPAGTTGGATFYRDVLPILQDRCQQCHRPGEIGPMPLLTYGEARPWAKAIREAAVSRKMPPWFADPRTGHFANDPSLTQAQIDILAAWAEGGAPEGSASTAPPRREWQTGWNIGAPDAEFRMPKPFTVPAEGELDYQYIIVPTGFTEDRWVRKVEIRPGNREVVHHAVVYVREPGSTWLRGMGRGEFFTEPARNADGSPNQNAVTTSDLLFTYTPGNSTDSWPEGAAKLIPAGSDLVFQMHYTAAKKAATDQTRIGLVFAAGRPRERVLSLQLTNDRVLIPPGVPDYQMHVAGTLPNDARLLSLYPHMHLRGKSFEYVITPPGGAREVLLRVRNYNFYWQLTYKLADPLLLRAGTRIDCTAVFDNSKNNPRNPEPEAMVRYGQQSSDEMMIGFFDVAVDAGVDKQHFFERHLR